jgi:hypothetical protein
MFKYLLILCLIIYLIYLFRYNNVENYTETGNIKLMGVTSPGEIYGFNGINATGTKLPGTLVNICLKNNNVWGVNSAAEIWGGDVSNPATPGWKKLPGNLVQICCDDFSEVLAGVNNARLVFVADTDITSNPNWRRLPREMINVTISNGKLYGIDVNNDIYFKPDLTTNDNWVKLSFGKLKQIVYSERNGNKLVGINSINDVYYADTSLTTSPNWIYLNKKMKYVTLFRGYVFGIDLEGIIWACNPRSSNKQWMQTNLPTNLNQISLYPLG